MQTCENFVVLAPVRYQLLLFDQVHELLVQVDRLDEVFFADGLEDFLAYLGDPRPAGVGSGYLVPGGAAEVAAALEAPAAEEGLLALLVEETELGVYIGTSRCQHILISGVN